MNSLIKINSNLNLDLIITKGYINTYDVFIKQLKEQYGIDNAKDITNLLSLVIIKNYLSAIEMNKIIESFSLPTLSLIQKINLTANNLEGIPSSFDSLINMKILILNNNKIKSISLLGQMTQLERLELRGNQIEKIESLNDLKQLKLLTLSNNQIKSITKEDIPELPEINDLGLFGNYLGSDDNDVVNIKQLTDLCSWIGQSMPKLKNIYLGGNPLSSIENIDKLAREHIKTLEKYDGHNLPTMV